MFCAFDNPALILRLYGRGTAVLPQDDGFKALAAHFPRMPGIRQVFAIDIDSVQTSCGWGVPRMTQDRPARDAWSSSMRSRCPRNGSPRSPGRTASIGGLPVRVQTRIPAA